jgi:hypothetical protein
MIDMAAFKKLRFMVCVRPVLALLFIILVAQMAYGCNTKTNDKGAINNMQTYYIGRFSIAIPAVMHEAQGSRSHQLRRVELDEKTWPDGVSHEKAREMEWNKFMAKIKEIPPTEGKQKVIIKMQDFPGVGTWSKGIFYHKNSDSKDEGTWRLLIDSGHNAVWLKGRPVLVEKENNSNIMAKNISNIGKSYLYIDSRTSRTKGDWFYLKHGAINLPYSWQEKSYIRFEGHPLNLKIEIDMDMDAGHKRPQFGLIEKTSAAIDSGYASAANVSIKNIRSQKREVAGLPGEEVIDRLTAKDKKTLDFGWEYVGKKDSGEYPTICITMESPDGNLDEKLKIWDAVLDSMKPVFERKK